MKELSFIALNETKKKLWKELNRQVANKNRSELLFKTSKKRKRTS